MVYLLWNTCHPRGKDSYARIVESIELQESWTILTSRHNSWCV